MTPEALFAFIGQFACGFLIGSLLCRLVGAAFDHWQYRQWLKADTRRDAVRAKARRAL